VKSYLFLFCQFKNSILTWLKVNVLRFALKTARKTRQDHSAASCTVLLVDRVNVNTLIIHILHVVHVIFWIYMNIYIYIYIFLDNFPLSTH